MERVLDHVDALTDDEREAYVQGSDGRWHLDHDIAALIDEHEAALAELRADTEQLRAKVSTLGSRHAYRRELTQAGTNPRLIEAACALLLERGAVDDDGYVETEHGPLPVSHVVSSFLASDEGSAFAPAKPTAGTFSAELARLRSLH